MNIIKSLGTKSIVASRMSTLISIRMNYRQADVDHSTETYSTIMAEMVEKQRPNLERMYQHMVLTLDNADADTRIINAFTINKTDEQWEEEQKRLENYVRGGLEIIDEIFGNCHSYEAICNAIYDLKDQIGL